MNDWIDVNELNSSIDPSPWPTNWRELLIKTPCCDRCGTVYADKLYCLNDYTSDLIVCRGCSDDYHAYIKQFVDEVRKIKEDRKKNQVAE